MTLRGGMSTLTSALANSLPGRSHPSQFARSRHRPRGTRPLVDSSRHGNQQWLDADAVIVASPANHAASMLASTDKSISETLGQIEYASCGVVSLAYRRDQIKHKLNTFGFVVPWPNTA
ncbi:MAG: FAD-dependent oxidoreductase [Pirellulaceae bacterium]